MWWEEDLVFGRETVNAFHYLDVDNKHVVSIILVYIQ